MSAIPNDILVAAEDAFMRASVMSLRNQQFEIIARAILAERERCAKVAEEAADVETETMWNAATKYILRRIRQRTET